MDAAMKTALQTIRISIPALSCEVNADWMTIINWIIINLSFITLLL